MDIIKSASNIIKLIYAKRGQQDNNAELVSKVCEYFDMVKDEKLTAADLRFLRYIASEAGVPQYFEMLNKFQPDIEHRELDVHMNSLPTLVEEAKLYVSDHVQLHRYQMDVLNLFCKNRNNRFFLSASTSFGKTFLIYEILRKMEYSNICFIFPTVALLSENLQKIFSHPAYTWVKDKYKIHTLSETELQENHNILIYTPERFLSFMDKHQEFYLDFLFVDEIYKIDNEYLVDDQQRENERDVAYRIATHIGIEHTKDCLLTGPYIDINLQEHDSSIVRFLNWANMSLIDFEKLEIVGKCEISLRKCKKIMIPDLNQVVHFTSSGKINRYKELVSALINIQENAIVYCSSKSKVESYANELISDSNFPMIDTAPFQVFLNHLESLFKNNKGKEWVVTKALKKGVGVHHGLVPKYIQNEIIHLFNKGYLKILIATTTITEGVNTTAKNMIVLSHNKGNKELKAFDAKNIEGRAGRFIEHYMGRIFVFDDEFLEIKDQKEEMLKHKYFDENDLKLPVDIPYIEDKYLTENEIKVKQFIDNLIQNNELPKEIFDVYKTISAKDKYQLFLSVKRLTNFEKKQLHTCILNFRATKTIHKQGLEIVLNIIKTITPLNSDISRLIGIKSKNNDYSILTNLISVYMRKGYVSSVNYYVNIGETVDNAARNAAKFVFNTLKYQTVKYLGLFNACYKYVIAQECNKNIDEISGFDSLLVRMEYNADTPYGRKASDIGVPFNVIDYYDKLYSNKDTDSFDRLDAYEKNKAKSIRSLIIQG